jgi:hypothetical protein
VVAGTSDPELLDAVAEGIRVEVQDSRRALWSLNNAASLLKDSEDVTALHVLQSGEP